MEPREGVAAPPEVARPGARTVSPDRLPGMARRAPNCQSSPSGVPSRQNYVRIGRRREPVTKRPPELQ
eukprot:2972900-Pyramimonas_sp.AAC.1